MNAIKIVAGFRKCGSTSVYNLFKLSGCNVSKTFKELDVFETENELTEEFISTHFANDSGVPIFVEPKLIENVSSWKSLKSWDNVEFLFVTRSKSQALWSAFYHELGVLYFMNGDQRYRRYAELFHTYDMDNRIAEFKKFMGEHRVDVVKLELLKIGDQMEWNKIESFCETEIVNKKLPDSNKTLNKSYIKSIKVFRWLAYWLKRNGYLTVFDYLSKASRSSLITKFDRVIFPMSRRVILEEEFARFCELKRLSK